MTGVDFHLPDFSLKEQSKAIIIKIVAPLSKPKEAAFILEKDMFTFESPPYLLKIKLPHSVLDRFSQKAYDSDTKTYKIKLRKSFELQQDDIEEAEEIVESVYAQGDETALKTDQNEKIQQFYGFANRYSNMFGKLYSEFSEVINLTNPDSTAVSERRNFRIKEENEKWDEDHYLADTMETDHLDSIFKYKPPWIKAPFRDEFSIDEKEILLELIDHSKVTQLCPENLRLSEFQIVDILFGYAYNQRTTEGDNTVESGWTINKLSSTLSWFEVFEDLKQVLLACYKRSLIFPLYRNWDLTQMVHKDVVNLMKLGPKQVTRCLLEIRDIFNESENRYILNSLYINDLCNFGYHMSEEQCLQLSKEVKNIKMKKFEVISDLPLLEVAARLILEENIEGSDKTEPDLDKVVDEIARLNLSSTNDASSDSSESDTSGETDSSLFSDKEN